MGLQIITAAERLAERRGVKALIAGQAGVGKTSLLRTLDPATTLFLDLEAGNLAVQDVAVDELRPETWDDCRDLAVFLSGPNANVEPRAVFGRKHYDQAVDRFGDPAALDKYETVFIDSLTVAGRLCFTWSEQQPEAQTTKGERDTRSAYGLHGREIIQWITRLQLARMRNVIFVCLLEQKEDEFKRQSWVLQIDGSKAGRELPGIVDEVLTMAIIRPDDGDPYRALIADPANPWGFPAKDRSGRLDPLEPPDLGALFTKLNITREAPRQANPSRVTA